MKYYANLSYGKDSIKMLDIIYQHGRYPLDEIITCDIYAKEGVSAYLPEVVEFRHYADEKIKERYGMEVTHLRSDMTFDDYFYHKRIKGKSKGKINGFMPPFYLNCRLPLKLKPIKEYTKRGINYIGYAINEKSLKRQNIIDKYRCEPSGILNGKTYPLVDFGVTEQEAYDFCKKNDLLSPVYENQARDGCFFCPCQSKKQLIALKENHPDLFKMMLDWEKESPWQFGYGKFKISEL